MTLDLLSIMTTHQQLIPLPTISVMSSTPTNDLDTYRNQVEIDTNVRLFWDSFPCPPPWRPSLLSSVNISKLGPQIGESVKNFLAGKCQLQAVVSGISPIPGWADGDGYDGRDPKGSDHHTTASSDHTWCNKTCQLAIGCSGVFVAMVIVALALVCLNRSRRKHKMPATRPSRQQLQMSASTSDPVNWAEFSNTQVQFDDDIIYPPFRHRDLPSPPTQCYHPSCDPKWTCTNGAFHPLMRVSPSSTTYCTHGYTAVYEKIDDEDEEVEENVPCHRGPLCGAGERTRNKPNSMTSGVPFIPVPQSDTSRQAEEETGFNGDCFPVSTLPRYFELEGTCPKPPTTSSCDDQLSAVGLNRESDSAWNQRDKFSLNSFLPHSTFLNSPTVCNQLCATCVANAVHKSPPCLNTHRSNGFIPNINSFNVIHMKPTVNNIPSNLSGYYPPNTSSFRQFSSNPNSLPSSDIPHTSQNDPPPYKAHGCDLRHRNTNKKDDNDSQLTNDDHLPNSNDIVPGFSALDQEQSHTCHVTQHASPIGSPCHQWCPTCQQVPLLRGNDSSNLHSASLQPTPINMPWYPFKSSSAFSPHEVPNTADEGHLENDNGNETIDNNNLEVEKDFGVEISSRNHSTATNQSLPNELWSNNGSEMDTEISSEQGAEAEFDEDCSDVSGQGGLSSNPSKFALSLHSSYFNKTSSA